MRRAEAAGVTILRYPYDTASAVQLLRCSRRVGSAVTGDFMSVPGSTLVSSLFGDDPGHASGGVSGFGGW